MRTGPSGQPKGPQSALARRYDRTSFHSICAARLRLVVETVRSNFARSFLRQLTFGGTTKRRNAPRLLRYTLKIFYERPALIIPQQRTDNAVTARTLLKRMTGVRVSKQSGIHQVPR